MLGKAFATVVFFGDEVQRPELAACSGSVRVFHGQSFSEFYFRNLRVITAPAALGTFIIGIAGIIVVLGLTLLEFVPAIGAILFLFHDFVF